MQNERDRPEQKPARSYFRKRVFSFSEPRLSPSVAALARAWGYVQDEKEWQRDLEDRVRLPYRD